MHLFIEMLLKEEKELAQFWLRLDSGARDNYDYVLTS
jgi:hypothetical protein